MTRALTDYPRPAQDTGIGLHLSANAYDNRHRDANLLARDVDLWRQMGVTWLKVVTASDSQLVSTAEYVKHGFEVIVRFWADKPHPTYRPAVDLMRRFTDVGVHYVEGGNEPDHPDEQSRHITPQELAVQYVGFADDAYRAGLIPVTYALESDRVYRWFQPMLQHCIDMGRRDAIEGSVIGVHNRPARMPIDSPAIDATQGGPGFVWRGYELFDDVVMGMLGHRLPVIGPEAGREPPETNGDLAQMAADNVDIATRPWRMTLFCQCFWLWSPGGMGGENVWIDNPRWGTLPVVKAFVDMKKVVRNVTEPPEPPEPEFPDDPPDPVADLARETANKAMETVPWGVKFALRHNLTPFYGQLPFDQGGQRHFAWPVHNSDGDTGLVVYPEGEYTDNKTRLIAWDIQ